MEINKYKIAIIVFLRIVLLCGLYVFVDGYIESKLIDETTKRVQSEMKLKQLEKEHNIIKIEIDSLKEERIKNLAIIEFQKKNPQIIIKKYEAIHQNIDNLTPSESYKLFTDNIIKYKKDSSRYSLQRFN